MNRNAQFILGVTEDNRVQFSSMTVEDRRSGIVFVWRLRVNKLTRPFMDVEAVVFQIDAKRS